MVTDRHRMPTTCSMPSPIRQPDVDGDDVVGLLRRRRLGRRHGLRALPPEPRRGHADPSVWDADRRRAVARAVLAAASGTCRCRPAISTTPRSAACSCGAVEPLRAIRPRPTTTRDALAFDLRVRRSDGAPRHDGRAGTRPLRPALPRHRQPDASGEEHRGRLRSPCATGPGTSATTCAVEPGRLHRTARSTRTTTFLPSADRAEATAAINGGYLVRDGEKAALVVGHAHGGERAAAAIPTRSSWWPPTTTGGTWPSAGGSLRRWPASRRPACSPG